MLNKNWGEFTFQSCEAAVWPALHESSSRCDLLNSMQLEPGLPMTCWIFVCINPQFHLFHIIISVWIVLNLQAHKIISSVLWLWASPIGVPMETMMTMTTLMADHTPPQCPTTIMTTSKPSSTPPKLTLALVAFTPQVLSLRLFYEKSLPGFL